MRRWRTNALVAVAAASVLLSGASPALASHFRSSNETLTISGEAMTWTLNSAWRKGSDDVFLGLGSTVPVKTTTAGATPDAGTASSVSGEVTSASTNLDDPLYDSVTEVITGDLTGVGATDGYDGMLEMYAENCCRVSGVSNVSGSDFSEWIKWTRNADGTYNLPPQFNDVKLYDMISGAAQTFDFTATDPESDAITYSLITDQSQPWYGAAALACSTFTGGILSLGPDLCAEGDVWGDIYTSGSFWAVKVMATDAGGNENVANLLLRVPVLPVIYGDTNGMSGNDQVFRLYNDDQDTTQPTDWSLTCTNDADPSDVISGTATTSPVGSTDITLSFPTPGMTYTCDPSGTNTVGTGSGNTFSYTVPARSQTITFPAVADTAVNQGPVALTATASSGLVVTYASTTPDVCTVDGSTVTLLTAGTCEITADQAGDTAYNAASQVSRSFTVLAAVVPPAPAPNGGGSSTPDPAPSATTTVPVAPAPPATSCGSDPACLAPVNPQTPVTPGASVALEDGVPVPVTVVRNAANSGLVATGDGWQLSLAGTDAGQEPVELTPDGRLVVERGRYATTTGQGFKPNSEVKVYLFSDPILLGTLMTDADGSFAGALPVPTTVPAGNHTLQVNGFAPNSEVPSVSLGVVLRAPSTKTAKTVVYFAAGSAQLDAAAKAKVRALVAKVKAKGKVASVGVRVVGFVQPTTDSSNDTTLSTARARAVAKQLKADGLKGKYNVSGMGKAAEQGAAARRVEVTVTYLPR